MDVFDHIEMETTGGYMVATGEGGTTRTGSGPVAGVLRGLKATGMSFLDVLAWLPVVLQLITTVGPKIAEIIDLIRKAIQDGKTPQTFTA